jgi:purine nucleosidase
MRKFIIDTDTASDDAVALIMAHRWPEVQVLAVTTVAGNVSVTQGTKNALYSIEMAGGATPVYVGCAKPLLRPIEFATWFHGEDGMGNMNYPEAKLKAQSGHAVDALIETIKAHPGDITLVTLGPLTNVAVALTRAPEIAPLVQRCVIMGGAANTVGNVTPGAEYNIWVDPEAAKIVFHSGMAMEMVGWEHSRFEASFTPAEMDAVVAIGTPLARFAMDCNKSALEASVNLQHAPGVSLADPTCMAVALNPDKVITRHSRHFVEVETLSEFLRGHTCVDELDVLHREPNMDVIWSIDVKQFKDDMVRCLR